MSDFDELGGEPVLRPLIADFVQTMVDDVMIGFFFADVDAVELTELEYQFTARALGAEVSYQGRPLRKAHGGRPIFGGQFDRRRELLRQAIDRHGVNAEIRDRWLAHVDSLRALVTRPQVAPPSPFRIVR